MNTFQKITFYFLRCHQTKRNVTIMLTLLVLLKLSDGPTVSKRQQKVMKTQVFFQFGKNKNT